MPSETSPNFSISMDSSKNITGSFIVNPNSVNMSAINWAQLLQAVMAAIPAIMAIIAAFTGSPAPSPTSPPLGEKS